MKLEAVAWIGREAYTAISVTPARVLMGDVPLYAIPEGYVVVKAEPDEAMIRAGESIDWINDGDTRANIVNMYQAMIAAQEE